MSTQNKYLNYLSSARLFAIYWVVLIQHNFAPFHPSWGWIGDGEIDVYIPLKYLFRFVTYITMPLCFFVSGFLAHNTNSLVNRKKWKDYFWKRIVRLLFPCWIFGVICQLLMYGKVSVDAFTGIHHLWFIYFLFIISSLAWFTMRKNNYKYVGLSFLFAFILIVLSKIYCNYKLYELGIYFIWFILGYIISLYRDYIRAYICYIPIFYFLILAIYLILNSINFSKAWVVLLVYEFIGIAMTIYIFRYIQYSKISIIPTKVFNLMNSTSYGVYIFHFLYLFSFYSIIKNNALDVWMINNSYWMTTVLAILTIPFSVITTLIFKNMKL